MTHIARLTTTNTKGRSFNLSFDPLTLIVGANFAGKTTVLDSIRLALMGKLPDAARNADIFRMSSGSRMAISLHLSDDIVISREYWTEGDGVRSSGTDAAEYVTPLLNSAEYFGLTAGERLGYIAARVKGGAQKDSKGIMAELLARWREAGIDTSAEGVENLNRMIVSELSKGGLQECLNRLLDKKSKSPVTLPNQFSHWNAVVKDRAGAVRTLAELKNREAECSAETIGEIREEIATIQRDLAEATERKGKFQQAKERSEATAAREKELKAWMAKPKGDFEAQLTTLRAILKEQQDRLSKIDLSGESARDLMKLMQEKAQRHSQALADCQQFDAKAKEILEEISDVEHELQCPRCGSKSKEWKKKKEDKIQSLNAELGQKNLSLNEAISRRDSLASEHTELQSRHNVRFQQEELSRSLTSEIERTESKIMLTERDDREEKHFVQSFTEELKTLTASAFDPDDLAGAEGDVRRLTGELHAAQERLQTATKLQQQLVSAVEAQEEHETASKMLEAVKIAGTFLKEKQQEGTNALIGGLLGTVNFFTKDIMVAPLALHESELGYFLPNGRFVQHDTFSGLEKLLTYCAMGCALSTTGRLRVALLDELGNLTTSMRHAILARARAAVAAGMLDQVISVLPLDQIDTDPQHEGWKIIRLTQKALSVKSEDDSL